MSHLAPAPDVFLGEKGAGENGVQLRILAAAIHSGLEDFRPAGSSSGVPPREPGSPAWSAHSPATRTAAGKMSSARICHSRCVVAGAGKAGASGRTLQLRPRTQQISAQPRVVHLTTDAPASAAPDVGMWPHHRSSHTDQRAAKTSTKKSARIGTHCKPSHCV